MSESKRGRFLLNDSESTVWLSEHLETNEKHELSLLFEKFRGQFHEPHVWVASSGSRKAAGQSSKLIALSHSALRASASAVNSHLEVKPSDVWLKALPSFHVGGLSIYVRAHLANQQVVELERWDVTKFVEVIRAYSTTLTSLVPTQIHDLCEAGLRCPQPLRAIIVGGAALDPLLYLKARNLGWPLLPSFGMTELGSQVATAELESLEQEVFPKLRILRHIEARVDANKQLFVRSTSMFSGCAQKIGSEVFFHRQEQDSFFKTNDLVEIENSDFLRPLGREDEFVKIFGEGVSLLEVEQLAKSFIRDLSMPFSDVCVFAEPDPRAGSKLVLAVEVEKGWMAHDQAFLGKWEEQLLEKGRQMHALKRWSEVKFFEKFPRSALGKVQKKQLEVIKRSAL